MEVKGLSLVFWGIVFASLDLRLNQTDILPDPLGYALAFSGCLAMCRSDGAAGLAALAAFVLIFLSIPSVVEHKEVLSTSGSVTYYYNKYWVVSVFKDLVELVFVWRLLSVIHDLARDRACGGLAEAALRCRKLYLWLTVAGVSWMALFWIYPPCLWLAFVPFLIFAIVVIVKLLRVISRAGRELSGDRHFA